MLLEETEAFITQLDVAVEAHLAWTRRVLRCSVLRVSPGEDVLAPDAHCRCQFGRWFTKEKQHFEKVDRGATARLFDQHRQMHDAVRSLCLAFLADAPGREADLDVFDMTQAALVAGLADFKTRFLAASARVDALTGLPLRHGLESEFTRFRAPLARYGLRAMVTLLDIDRFKAINDEYGHSCGDIALRHVAGVLTAQSRSGELIFRFGGEEFLQIAKVTGVDDASFLAERMLQALRDSPAVLPGGRAMTIRASAGFAVVAPDEPMLDAIERADRALYSAKAAGRDRWLVAA